ncbi:hypothetical protein IL306_003745 [Fusarium sp. DS 682]|nr:hypothetical protein IL306_003745 [Fusarium sp. DS 682]
MASVKSSPGRGPEATDATFKGLITPAQRSVARKIYRLSGSFPWEIAPPSVKTTWTQGVLDSFLETITVGFSGQQLGDRDKRRLRSVLMEIAKQKDSRTRLSLTQSDFKNALNHLNNADEQSRPGLETPKPSAAKMKPSSSASNSSKGKFTAKRARVEGKTPPASPTSSSKRQKGEACTSTSLESSQTPIPKRDPTVTMIVNSDTESDFGDMFQYLLKDIDDQRLDAREQPNDNRKEDEPIEEDNSSPDPDSQLLQTAAEHERRNAIPTPFHDAEEEFQNSAHGSLAQDSFGQVSAASPRKIEVTSLSMTDQQIGDKIRKTLSVIADKQQATINGRLAELDAEANRASSTLVDAKLAVSELLEDQKRQANFLAEASKRSDNAQTICKTAANALTQMQALARLGNNNFNKAIEDLDQAVRDAVVDQEEAITNYKKAYKELENTNEKLEDAKKTVSAVETQILRVCQMRDDFKKDSEERKITCTVRIATDAKDDDGDLFDDFVVEFDATVRKKMEE